MTQLQMLVKDLPFAFYAIRLMHSLPADEWRLGVNGKACLDSSLMFQAC